MSYIEFHCLIKNLRCLNMAKLGVIFAGLEMDAIHVQGLGILPCTPYLLFVLLNINV
jgi:hypothetical protein